MGFKITKEGAPIYTVDLAPIKYEEIEEIKLPNGKTAKRTVTKEYIPEPLTESVESKGWSKKIQFKDVVILRIPDAKDYNKIKPTLFLRTIEVDAEKYFDMNTCGHCKANGHGHRFHFVKHVTDTLCGICWACAVHYGRSSFTISALEDVRSGSMNAWAKIIEEKPISVKDAMRFYKENGRIIDANVMLMMQEKEGQFEVV